MSVQFPVDYVFPWVNPADEFWQEQYCKASGTKFSADNPRFRDWGTLKYVFRSIDMYAPWIDRVCLIVSDRTQLPSWINYNNIEVIVHSDFIPSRYLPTFNSNTIEMFYANLSYLHEHILYGNDDLYFTKMTSPEDFFTEKGLPRLAFKSKNLVSSDFLKTVKRTSDLIKRGFKNDYVDSLVPTNIHFIKQAHLCTPILKSTIQAVYSKYRTDIEKSITQFRDNDKNLNQYMYTDYQIMSGRFERVGYSEIGSYISFTDKTLGEVKKIMMNPPSKILCLNDNNGTEEIQIREILKVFEIIYPNKSKFEK